MKHCEKCLYYEKCKVEMDEAPDDIFTFFPYNEDCPHFKNKADFVEVVRCKDCKHRGKDECMFHINGEPADEEFLLKCDNDFCSYGERKTDNDI